MCRFKVGTSSGWKKFKPRPQKGFFSLFPTSTPVLFIWESSWEKKRFVLKPIYPSFRLDERAKLVNTHVMFSFLVIHTDGMLGTMNVRRSSSLSEIPASFDVERPLVCHHSSHGAKAKREQRKKNKGKESLRRCKSTPNKKPTKQSRETNPYEWKCAWDKERVYVTDLIAEQNPTTNQPQLSYFAYLGNNYPGKGRYQAVSSNTETIINLGNGIIAQTRSASTTNAEEGEFHGNDVRIDLPMKPAADRTRLLECCSCMCCVKAVFYHCTKDRNVEKNWADEPCTCEWPGTECVTRWGILGMFSLFLPCLVCYPVLKVCCYSPFSSMRKWKS